jgi:hypothetical protein
MIKRENAFVEAIKFVRSRNNELVEESEKKAQEKIHEHAKFMNDYYKIKQSRLDKQRERVQLYESAQNQELATAIKAIYITALEAETLTDNGILLAEELVDKWIATEGGAAKILRENKNKTYLLNRICTIVEEAARADLKAIYEAEDEDEDDITGEEDTDEVDYDLGEDSGDDEGEGESDETEEVVDDPETEEETPVEDDEIETDSNGDVKYGVDDEKDSADNVTADEEHDEPKVQDEVEKQMDEELPDEDSTSEEDIDEEIADDEAEADVEAEPEDYDNKVLEDLDKEEDVQKAVALIRQRVADAEETFIKNNARDKEQINALLGKISDNIKTVEDMTEKDKEAGKDAVAQENVRMSRRGIDNITNNRPLSIMEMFARSLNKDIIRDDVLKEHYIEENGKLDMDTIVESAKVLYGFLETLNTIQIGRKIDKAYLEEIF